METYAFYGVTLSEKDSVAQFEATEHLVDEKLIIRQIILGAEAVEGEYNVVQAEQEGLKIPIAVLKLGETRILRPNLEFPNSSVTFKLIQGKGPVHINGQHVHGETDEGDGEGYYEDEECSDEEEEIQPQTNGKTTNKRK